MTQAQSRPLAILLCALGGEGGGVLAKWLVDAAHWDGYPVQATSIPGVAQRTGATTYYVEIFPELEARLAGKRPIFSLNPLPGRIDLLVSSELLESARQISLGMSDAKCTHLISSSHRTLTTQEKIQMGDGRMDEAALLMLLQTHAKVCSILDMDALTRRAGTVVSAVMLGCIAASGALPLTRQAYEVAIGSGSVSQQASLRGFSLAWDALTLQTKPTQSAEQTAAAESSLPLRVATLFPVDVHDILGLGYTRLLEYQSERYAALYVDRLQVVLATEKATTSTLHQITRETARWLALWMAFDDIVRVADLKSRVSRMARVRHEVKADLDEIVKVFDFFKPGIPELAGMLPSGLADFIMRWDARRVQRGLSPFEFPLKVGSHSVAGMLMLRFLANLKWLRVRGSRYAREQSAIEEWLSAVVQSTALHPDLGLAVARCGQLIKGYGSTNSRGHENWQHILSHLLQRSSVSESLQNPKVRAKAVDEARAAALHDEAGAALNKALQAYGAPKRDIKPQPIRWMPRRSSHH